MTRRHSRCDTQVYNKAKRRYHKCHNGIYRTLDGLNLCWIHYNKRCGDAIVTIQKNYRGYKARRYLKLYRCLPDDIQIIVKRRISQEYYERLYCQSIYRLLQSRYKKMNKVLDDNNFTYREIAQLKHIMHDDLSNVNNKSYQFIRIFIDYIYPVYRLYNKYFDILSLVNIDDIASDIEDLHVLSYPVLDNIRVVAQSTFYDWNNTILSNRDYNILINSIFIINSLSQQYEDYYVK